MLSNRRSIVGVSISCLALIVTVFSGCADFGDITGPERQTEAVDQAKYEQPSIAPPAGLNWLRYAPTEGLAKTVRGDTSVEGFFKPGEDLTLILGETSEIFMRLEIPGDALDKETVISMSLPEPGSVMMDLGAEGVFGPSGLEFLKPVKWTIKSNSIDINPEKVEDLGCYCWEEEWKDVEDSEAELNGRKLLILTCWIKHFSRYAWA